MRLIWDKKRAQYRDERGRFVSGEQVNGEIDKLAEQTSKELRQISRKLVNGKISQVEWLQKMKQLIKSSHLVAASVANGGIRQMDAAALGKLGSILKEQYKYLNNFSREIQKGITPISVVESRAVRYSFAVRQTFHNANNRVQQGIGKTHSKRILRASESCPECVEWARKGFVSIRQQPPIGSLVCRSFCKCSLKYR